MKNNNWYPWVVVGLLWVVALLNYMDRQMLSTMQEAMKIDISELNKAEAFGALIARTVRKLMPVARVLRV